MPAMNRHRTTSGRWWATARIAKAPGLEPFGGSDLGLFEWA